MSQWIKQYQKEKKYPNLLKLIFVFSLFFSGKYSLLQSVLMYTLKFNRKSLGSQTFLIKLSIIQNYLFLQYLIGRKDTDMIALPAQKDVLVIHSNNSNILGNTVNKYQNDSVIRMMFKWQEKAFF